MKKILFVIICSWTICSCKTYTYYIDQGDCLLNSNKIQTKKIDDYVCLYFISTPKMCVYQEIENAESEDYHITHTQYYNSHKKLVAYKRYAKYFDSNDNVLEETTIYDFRKGRFNKISYLLSNNGNNIIDTLNQTFDSYYDDNYKVSVVYPKN